jgi:hypothetical protein
MTRLITLLVTAALLAGCAPKKSTELTLDPRMWFIESYDHGMITARNDGKTYKATCEGHRTLGPDQFVYDPAPSFPCRMAIDEVGASIQPIALDTDFRRPVLFMGQGIRGSLILRRQDTVETFTVTSVTKTHR